MEVFCVNRIRGRPWNLVPNKKLTTNVVKDPERDFNAVRIFFVMVVHGHIVAAYHEIQMENFDPTAEWINSKTDQERMLTSISTKIMEKFVNFFPKTIV